MKRLPCFTGLQQALCNNLRWVRSYCFIICGILLSTTATAGDIVSSFSKIYIENRGQVKDENGTNVNDVLFYSQGRAMQLFITTTGYAIVTKESNREGTAFHKIDFTLENASLSPEQVIFVKGDHPTINFYHAENALENVRTTDMVIIRRVYPGIDWVWTFDQHNNPKHEFMVNIGADASVIQYAVSGADAKLSEGNNIIYANEKMGVKEGPVLIQYKNEDFPGDISLKDNRISFNIPENLSGGGFTIDPPLELLWGASDTIGTSFKGITPDVDQNTITVGYSSDYAVPSLVQVSGSYGNSTARNKDLLIMKSDIDQDLVWATFFGGSRNDEANAVTASPSGIFITGYSNSWNFPQASHGNYTRPVDLFGSDAFIAKFDNQGKWIWSTGYGGDNPDEGLDIEYFNGRVYVVGYTSSDTFPTLQKPGAYFYQDTLLTSNDAFLLEFDTAGNRIWATCFGGTSDDHYTSLFVDSSGIYTSGYSKSDSIGGVIPLQTTGSAYFQSTFEQAESFVNKFSSAGMLQWSSYFGGSGNDYATSIVRNDCGLFICGSTDSSGLPVLSQGNGNYFQPNYAGGETDGFIAKFDANSLQQLYCSYYGTSSNDVLTKMGSDADCNTIFTGYTNDSTYDLQIVGSPLEFYVQDTIKGGYDGIMLALDNNQIPFWTTYFGSRGNDFGYDLWFPNRYLIDMVGEGFYNYGKLRIGGTYVNDSCTNIKYCPHVTTNGVSNRFLLVDTIGSLPGGGGGGLPSGCDRKLQFQALIPLANTCPDQCNGIARIDTANIGGCPPYRLTWNSGGLGLIDSNLCEFYWTTVFDDFGQNRTIYGRFDIFRVEGFEEAETYCSFAQPGWDTIIHMAGGGPPYTINYRGALDSCPSIAYFNLIDTAGCIISHSLPWSRYNINLSLNFILEDTCELRAILPAFSNVSCLEIPDGTNVVLNDGLDTFLIPYARLHINSTAPPFIVEPGKYYSGYLDLPDCEIPIGGVYSYNTIQDSITKILACQDSSGSIEILVYPDSIALNQYGTFGVGITVKGDSTGTLLNGSLTFTTFSPQTYTFNNLPADNYVVTVEPVGACRNARSVTRVDLRTVDFEFNVPDVHCGKPDTLIATITGGFPPFIYQWSPPVSNSAYVILNNPGTYSLTITDNQGCAASNSIHVPGSTPLSNTVSENLEPCGPGLFSKASVLTTGGTPPYFYIWSSGELGDEANFLTPGTDWVQVYDINECLVIDSFQNTKQFPMMVNDSSVDASCYEDNDGSINLTVTHGYPNYSIDWSNGDSAFTLQNLYAGGYGYTITDLQGCEFTDSIILTEPDSINYFQFTLPATCSAYDGIADVNVVGGSGNYIIVWDDNDSSFARNDLNAGIHSFTITDNNGCSQTGSVEVVQYNPPLNAFFSVDEVTCYGGNDGLAAIVISNLTQPITYFWDNGDTDSITYSLDAGFHTVEIEDSNGCEYNETVIIDQPDSLYVVSIQTGEAFCTAPDGFVSINVSGGTQPYQAAWTDGGAGLSRNDITAGPHGFTITDANGCQISDSVTIPEDNPLIVDLTINNISCFGKTDGAAAVVVTNALTPVTYQWSTTSQQTSISGLPAGGYSLTVMDNRNCISIEQFQIVEPTQFVANVDTGNGIACYGDQVQVQIYGTGGTLPYNGSSDFYGAGTYTDTITDFNNCPASVTFALSQPDTLIANVSIVQPTCDTSGSVTISALGGTPPYTAWYASVNHGDFDSSITLVAVPGNNSIQVFDSLGCQINLTALVSTTGLPVANATSKNPLCNGDNTGSVKIVMTQGVGPFNVDGNTFPDSINLQGLTAGSYTYIINDAVDCKDTIAFTLTEPTPLTTGYDVLQEFVCHDDSLRVSFYGDGGTPPYTGGGTLRLPGGNFNRTITDANGCTADTTIVLDAPPPLTIDTSITAANCNNDSGYVFIDANGGVSPYSIKIGQRIIPFSDTVTLALLPGSYAYTVSDSLGCFKDDSFTLDAVNFIAGRIQSQDVRCNGDSTGSITITMQQGSPPYEVNGSSFTDSITFSNLPAGIYQYTVTDQNFCSLSLSDTIVQPSALMIDSTAVSSELTCYDRSDAVLKVYASGGTPFYNYLLVNAQNDTTSQTGNVFIDLGPNTYSAIVKDSFGCVTTRSAAINPFIRSTHQIELDNILCYGEENGAIKIYSEPSERSTFTYSLDNESAQVYNVFYNLPARDYRVVVADQNNCPDTLYTTISQPDSIDSRVWLNGELLPMDSLWLEERLLAEFTKQNTHPWEIDFSPDVETRDNTDSLVSILPREDITFFIKVYLDSLNSNCFIEHTGFIALRNIPPMPNILTPNGDGFNDTWEVDLDKFPNPELTIFDRWGEIIYESEDYTNDWDGQWQGNYVADGTYFYLLKVPSHGDKVYKGNINVLNSSR